MLIPPSPDFSKVAACEMESRSIFSASSEPYGPVPFSLTTKSIAKPGKATFVFKNIGHVEHDFKINGKVTPLIRPGKTATLAITFKKKGKYAYLCTVPGHAAAGMRGAFTVR